MNAKAFTDRSIGRLMIAGTALLWGLAGVCVKMTTWNPFSAMAFRCFISLIILAVSRKSLKIHCNKKTFAGTVAMSLTGILYMAAIKLTTAATAIVLQYVAPVLVFLYTVFFRRVRPRAFEIISVIVVFGGCALSFADKLDASHILGNALGLGSGIAFASQLIIMNDPDADADSGTFLSNLLSFAVCVPFVFFDRGAVFDFENMKWLLILGVFQYGFANLLYSRGCQKVGKLECSLILTIEPIFNPIPVWLVFGEVPGPFATAGFFVVITGIVYYFLRNMLIERKSA